MIRRLFKPVLDMEIGEEKLNSRDVAKDDQFCAFLLVSANYAPVSALTIRSETPSIFDGVAIGSGAMLYVAVTTG